MATHMTKGRTKKEVKATPASAIFIGGKVIKVGSDSIRSSAAAEYDIQGFLDKAADLAKKKVFRVSVDDQNESIE